MRLNALDIRGVMCSDDAAEMGNRRYAGVLTGAGLQI